LKLHKTLKVNLNSTSNVDPESSSQAVPQPRNIDFFTGIVNNVDTSCIIANEVLTQGYDVFVCAVFDSSNSKIYIIQYRPLAKSSTKLGEILTCTINDQIHITEFQQAVAGVLQPAIAINWVAANYASSRGYYAASVAGVFAAASLTAIVDVDFPPNQTPAKICVGRFESLNGTLYIMTLDAMIFNSDPFIKNDATAWKSDGFIYVYQYPDQGVGLARYKHHLLAFGKDSVEFFNDVGESTTPLGRTEQAFIKFGAKTARCIRNIDDIIYWVAYGSAGVTGVWKLDGYTPVKISSSREDALINTQFQSSGDSYPLSMYGCTIGEKRSIICNGFFNYTFPYSATSISYNGTDTYTPGTLEYSANIMCYNIEDKTWWGMQVQSNRGASVFPAYGYPSPLAASSAQSNRQYCLISVSASASLNNNQYVYYFPNLLAFSSDATDDGVLSTADGVPTVCWTMNTAWFNNEKRKVISKFKWIMYPWHRASGDATVSSLYLIHCIDNELDTSGTLNVVVRSVPMPSPERRYYINNLGTGRSWQFASVVKNKTMFRMKMAEIDVVQGTG
jgi:hypothetical protein